MTAIPVAAGELVGIDYLNEVARGHYRKTTTKTVNTTVAATDLLNGEITIGQNVLGSTGVMRITCHGDWKQNSGGLSEVPRFQFVVGGTTILDTGASTGSNAGNSATREAWWLDIYWAQTGAVGTQSVSMRGQLGIAGGVAAAGNFGFTTGTGNIAIPASAGVALYTGRNSTTKDNSVGTLAVVLNVINASASASYETTLTDALVEII